MSRCFPCGRVSARVCDQSSLLNLQNQQKEKSATVPTVKSLWGNIRGVLSTETLAAIGACVLLVLLVALTMRDKKPRFRFDATPTPAPVATATPAGSSTVTVSAPSSNLQTLFEQGRVESPLIAPVDEPPFVTNTDYASPPVYREIKETDLGRVYVSASKKDRRALGKVAKLGGFHSPEEMAQAFGYPSVDQMLWNWEQTIAATPQFQPGNFGTNASPPLPW